MISCILDDISNPYTVSTYSIPETASIMGTNLGLALFLYQPEVFISPPTPNNILYVGEKSKVESHTLSLLMIATL